MYTCAAEFDFIELEVSLLVCSVARWWYAVKISPNDLLSNCPSIARFICLIGSSLVVTGVATVLNGLLGGLRQYHTLKKKNKKKFPAVLYQSGRDFLTAGLTVGEEGRRSVLWISQKMETRQQNLAVYSQLSSVLDTLLVVCWSFVVYMLRIFNVFA